MNVTICLSPDHATSVLRKPFFDALAASAAAEGVRARLCAVLSEPDEVILGWGHGTWWSAADRFATQRWAMFDLGYFGRKEKDPPFRVAFGKMHNPEIVARDWPADRWKALGIRLRNDWSPDGPVIIVGQGRKSCVMYGEEQGEWERRRLDDVRAAYSGRAIVFRPKPGAGHLTAVKGARSDTRAIEDVLRGAALVVCRHSNVALDALIAGVPVVCDDGLAAAVCPSEMPTVLQPVGDTDRLRVLRCAAWMQWTRAEARDGSFWRFLRALT